MWGTLWNQVEIIPNEGFHFMGIGFELYNFGTYNYMDNLLKNVNLKHSNVIKDLPGDIEWMRMDKEFRTSLYEKIISGNSSQYLSMMKYPWKIIHQNIKRPIVPVLLSIKDITGSTQKVEVTTSLELINEIGYYNRYRIGNYTIPVGIENLPLSLVVPSIDSENVVYKIRALSANPTANFIYNLDLRFTGHIDHPLIILDDGDIITPDKVVQFAYRSLTF